MISWDELIKNVDMTMPHRLLLNRESGICRGLPLPHISILGIDMSLLRQPHLFGGFQPRIYSILFTFSSASVIISLAMSCCHCL